MNLPQLRELAETRAEEYAKRDGEDGTYYYEKAFGKPGFEAGAKLFMEPLAEALELLESLEKMKCPDYCDHHLKQVVWWETVIKRFSRESVEKIAKMLGEK